MGPALREGNWWLAFDLVWGYFSMPRQRHSVRSRRSDCLGAGVVLAPLGSGALLRPQSGSAPILGRVERKRGAQRATSSEAGGGKRRQHFHFSAFDVCPVWLLARFISVQDLSPNIAWKRQTINGHFLAVGLCLTSARTSPGRRAWVKRAGWLLRGRKRPPAAAAEYQAQNFRQSRRSPPPRLGGRFLDAAAPRAGRGRGRGEVTSWTSSNANPIRNFLRKEKRKDRKMEKRGVHLRLEWPF